MPCSGYELINPLMNKVREIAIRNDGSLKVKNALDLGVGMGQWGFCLRTYLDYYYGRFNPAKWELYMTGVEGYPKYKCPTWELYDQLHVGLIQDYLTDFKDLNECFDLVLLIEVLEHFNKEDGRAILARMKEAPHIFFTYFNGEQDAVYGNELEVHRAKWTDAEIREIFPNAECLSGNDMGRLYYVHNK